MIGYYTCVTSFACAYSVGLMIIEQKDIIMNWKMTVVALICSFITIVSYADGYKNVDLLASSCAACHGTNGHSVGGTPSLAGLDKLHFTEQMNQFINGTRTSTVMSHHASGYNADEVELLAEFFSKQ